MNHHTPDTSIKLAFSGTRCAFSSGGREVSDLYLYNQYALLAADYQQASQEADRLVPAVLAGLEELRASLPQPDGQP